MVVVGNLIAGAFSADVDGYRHMAGWSWMLLAGPVATVGIVGAVVAISTATRWSGQAQSEPGPLDILATRYARGEISTDDYHERLGGLRRPVNARWRSGDDL